MKKGHKRIVRELIECLTDGGIGLQVGAHKCVTSAHVLRNTNTQYMYLVDPWIAKSPENDWDYFNNQAEADGVYSKIDSQLHSQENLRGRYKIMRMTSEEAVTHIPDGLDFVCIDADHRYERVIQDLDLWVPKVNPGGLILGHDWNSRFPGVEKAVVEYFTKNPVIQPPFSDYSRFEFLYVYKNAPSVNSIVNCSRVGHIWWALKKDL